MTRSRDVADTQDNLGGAVAPFVGAKNIVINGGFDIYQRTAVSTTSSAYGLDRWFTIAAGSASATVLTQQTTGVPNGSRYCMRIAMGASGGYGNQFHFIETSNAAQLWGRTATLSLKLRRNATYAGTLSASVSASPTVDAGSGATWTALTATGVTVASNASLPTGTNSSNWLTISFQVDIPADGSANSLRVSVAQSQVEASGAYWEMAQVQLEAGSVPTPFTRTGGSIGGELALCQRYYQKSYPIDIAPGGFFLGGYSIATLQIDVPNSSYYNYQRLITRMRVAPTVVVYSGSGALSRMSTVTASDLAANSAVPNSISDTGFGIQNGSGGTLTQSAGGYLFYYTAIAEL
jgi:hypothetical protein